MIAEFRVDSLLGRGAMAAVYKAVQVSLERPVALKVLPSEFVNDTDFVERFFNEARSAAALSHPNIVQAYDAGITEDDICYFAMEFVEGESLLERVEREGALKPAMALQVMKDIALALEYGWKRQRLTHGDIKPANIMINERGIPKLADFGLAKIADFEFEDDGIMLTPLYAAPELIQGQTTSDTCVSDVYSFGATLYHLLVGEPPFPGDDPETVMRRQIDEALTPAIKHNPALHPAISRWLDTLLEKAPEQRPDSWNDIAQKAEELLESCTTIASAAVASPTPPPSNPKFKTAHKTHHRPTAPRKDRTPLYLTLIIMLLLANAFGLWLLLHEKDPPPEEQPATPPNESTTTQTENAPADSTTAHAKPTPQDKHPPPHADAAERVDLVHEETIRKQFRELLENDADNKTDGRQTPTDHIETTTVETEQPETPKTPTPAPDPKQIGDDYTEFCHKLGTFTYSPPFNLEPLVTLCRDWLENHPSPDADEVRKVEFILNSILPNLDRLPATLIANDKELVGVILPDFNGQSIAALTTEGVQIVLRIDGPESTSAGEVRHLVPWSELRHPKYYYMMCRELLGRKTVAEIDKLPCLAFMTLVRAQKNVHETLRGLSTLPDRTRWREIADDIYLAPRDRTALMLWRECRTAAENGELVRAHELLEQIEEQPSVIRFRYNEEIHVIKERCNQRVPQLQAAIMVEQALNNLNTDPALSLNLLGIADARFGTLDFPERASIDGLRRRAIQQMLDNVPAEQQNDVAHYWTCVPYALNPSHPRDYPTLVRWNAVQANPESPESARELKHTYEALGLMEIGAWGSARDALLQFSTAATDRLPPHHQAVMTFAAALVRQRYYQRQDDMRESIESLQKQRVKTNTILSETMIGLLSLKLSILANATQHPAANTIDIIRLTPEHNRHFVKPALLCSFVLEIESGDLDKFQQQVRRLAENTRFQELAGFSDKETQTLESVAQFLAGTDSAQLVYPHRQSMSNGRDAYTRLLLAAILAKPGLNKNARLAQIARLAPHTQTDTLLGADTWYQILLFQIAADLDDDRPDDAVVRCINALDEHSPNTVPFYTRLRILEAALELADARPKVAIETLKTVPLSTVASDRELKMVAQFLRGDEIATVTMTNKEADTTPPWNHVLEAARRIAKSETDTAVKILDATPLHSATAAEGELVRALQNFARRRQEKNRSTSR